MREMPHKIAWTNILEKAILEKLWRMRSVPFLGVYMREMPHKIAWTNILEKAILEKLC